MMIIMMWCKSVRPHIYLHFYDYKHVSAGGWKSCTLGFIYNTTMCAAQIMAEAAECFIH